jgi:hypothetical protein
MSVMLLSIASAQDCTAFFPMEEGSVREMTSYDKKDKVTGTIIQTVKEVKKEGERIDIVVEMEMKDKKGKQVSQGELVFTCEEGIFKVDMRNYLDPGSMQGMDDMEFTVDATELEMPADLEPGMELGDGSISMSASSGGMAMMNFNTFVTNRKVEGKETITTPAGTFECYKISQDMEVKSIMSIKTSSIEWVAEDVGVVKSESYNKNGKLTGYTLLTSLE